MWVSRDVFVCEKSSVKNTVKDRKGSHNVRQRKEEQCSSQGTDQGQRVMYAVTEQDASVPG